MSIIDICDFEILNLLGKGQNPVYRVKCKKTEKEFALKKVRRKEFQHHLVDLQEVLYLIQCDHPHIVKVLGFSMSLNKINMEFEYILYVLMDLMKYTLAEDLKRREESKNVYTKEELAKILLQTSSALIYLQKQAKLAHRDIKPDNILIDNEGNCFLTDFGECFWPSKFKPKASTLVGSPYYLAPELKEVYLLEGCETIEYDPWKSDVWSFGMTLLDLASTSYASKESLEAKYDRIMKNYGESWVLLIKRLLRKEVKFRIDFLGLEIISEIQAILDENYFKDLFFFLCNNEKKEKIEIPKDFKEEIDSVSQGVYELFQKIKNNGSLDEKLEEEFDEKIQEIEELEKLNQSLKEGNYL